MGATGATGPRSWRPRARSAAIYTLIAAACLALPRMTPACGPFFPNDILSKTDADLTAAPVSDFAMELERLKPHDAATVKAVIPVKVEKFSWGLPEVSSYGPAQTAAADLADLQSALKESGAAQATIDKATQQLTAFRKTIVDVQQAHLKWADREWDKNRGPEPLLPDLSGNHLDALPQEFADYQRGAIAYHAGKLEDARKSWLAVLALPKAQRLYRSTWAAYMIGRTYSASDPAKAIEHFRLTRTLAKSGFHDALGLAAASIGWEAYSELHDNHYETALALYLDQAATGDLTAASSVREVAAKLLTDKNAPLIRLAKDETSRRVITAWIISAHRDDYPDDSNALGEEHKSLALVWLKAIEAANIQNAPGLDHLAWLAYCAGDIPATKRFLARADKDSGITLWLQAKLAMRDGNLAKAAEFLDQAAKFFPENEEWPDATESKDADPTFRPRNRIRGELAVLKLARSQYSTALDLLLKGGYWSDAAYVAERVLTPDEFKTFVDQHVYKTATQPSTEGYTPPDPNRQLRHLLARRLLRLGRWKEARPYFPTELQPKMDAYIAAIRTGNDAKTPKAQRAQALMTAAKIARFDGMELLATELEPDGAMDGGNFTSGKLGDPAKRGDAVNVLSDDERKRAAIHEVPDQRWHYRYIALDHAWSAAEFMPDDSEQLALLCCEAGGWVKAQDPKAADRFYKLLVKRCPNTPLGRSAAQLHWFPLTTQPATKP